MKIALTAESSKAPFKISPKQSNKNMAGKVLLFRNDTNKYRCKSRRTPELFKAWQHTSDITYFIFPILLL